MMMVCMLLRLVFDTMYIHNSWARCKIWKKGKKDRIKHPKTHLNNRLGLMLLGAEKISNYLMKLSNQQ